MNVPDNLKYTKEHEWVRIEDNCVYIGITDHAQEQLGDIVFVELPDEGTTLEKTASFGVVESVKAVSDVYAPLSGKVVETNEALTENPESVNEDCYGEGWLIKLELNDKDELNQLMDPTQYEAFIEEETA